MIQLLATARRWVAASSAAMVIFWEAREIPGAHVYIMASKRNGTLYTGLSGKLVERLDLHRTGRGSQFVWKYRVFLLVYMEWHVVYTSAIQRETNIKKWKRAWKIALIEGVNPEWRDLTAEL